MEQKHVPINLYIRGVAGLPWLNRGLRELTNKSGKDLEVLNQYFASPR